MSLEHLIVGWNRGALGYVHELLDKTGADVGLTFGPGTTHEEMLAKLPEAHTFEVSPYVVPFLHSDELKHVKVTFIVRDPMRVLNSLYFHGMFHNEKDSPAWQTARTYLHRFEAAFKGKPGQAICSYINHWYRMTKAKRPDSQDIIVEEGPRHLLKKVVGHPVHPIPFVPPTVNASGCKQILVPSKLPDKFRWGMLDLVMKLGYRHWAWDPRGGHAHYVNADWHC